MLSAALKLTENQQEVIKNENQTISRQSCY